MKEPTGTEAVHMNQVRLKDTLEVDDLPPQLEQTIHVDAMERRPKGKPMDVNAAVLFQGWQIRLILTGHDNNFMTTLPQRQKELTCHHLSATHVGPKQLLPEKNPHFLIDRITGKEGSSELHSSNAPSFEPMDAGELSQDRPGLSVPLAVHGLLEDFQ
jgi:hypothetical protein